MLSPPFNYPDNALPQKLGEAVRQMQRAVQAPLPMIASSAICAIALACQRGFSVERKPDIVYPVGLAFLTIAGASERKSSMDRRFLKPIRDFELLLETQVVSRLKEWHASQAILVARKNGLTRVITKMVTRGEDPSITEQELAMLLKSVSDKPTHTRLIMNDASIKSMLNFLKNYGGSCGVMVDEGAVFFDSSAAKHAGMLARLWSGDEVRFDGTDEPGFTIRSPRFSMSIMVQPEILIAFLANKGKNWRDIGLLARFLLSYPISTMGTRYEDIKFPVTADLGSYDARIHEILSCTPCRGAVDNVTLKFEDSARQDLANYANFLESHIGPWGYFSDISDAASKIAENAARMAAVFHIFEGYEGDISIDTLSRAKEICGWHLSEFKRLFGKYPQVPVIEQDAQDIELCIRQYHAEIGYPGNCPKNRISQRASISLRKDISRREAAFAYLVKNNRIIFIRLQNDKTTYVNFWFSSHSTIQPFNSVLPYLSNHV